MKRGRLPRPLPDRLTDASALTPHLPLRRMHPLQMEVLNEAGVGALEHVIRERLVAILLDRLNMQVVRLDRPLRAPDPYRQLLPELRREIVRDVQRPVHVYRATRVLEGVDVDRRCAAAGRLRLVRQSVPELMADPLEGQRWMMRRVVAQMQHDVGVQPSPGRPCIIEASEP